MNDWIDVEERLPTVGVSVLVFTKPGAGGYRLMFRTEEPDVWRNIDNSSGLHGWVTHWIPLPASPDLNNLEGT